MPLTRLDLSSKILTKRKVQLLEPLLTDHHSGIVKAEDLGDILLGNLLLPKLLRKSGCLIYEPKDKDKINKHEYKDFLSMIAMNRNNIMNSSTDDKKTRLRITASTLGQPSRIKNNRDFARKIGNNLGLPCPMGSQGSESAR